MPSLTSRKTASRKATSRLVLKPHTHRLCLGRLAFPDRQSGRRWTVCEDRELIYWRFFQEKKLTHVDIGRRLGRTEDACKGRLSLILRYNHIAQPVFDWYFNDHNLALDQPAPATVIVPEGKGPEVKAFASILRDIAGEDAALALDAAQPPSTMGHRPLTLKASISFSSMKMPVRTAYLRTPFTPRAH